MAQSLYGYGGNNYQHVPIHRRIPSYDNHQAHNFYKKSYMPAATRSVISGYSVQSLTPSLRATSLKNYPTSLKGYPSSRPQSRKTLKNEEPLIF